MMRRKNLDGCSNKNDAVPCCIEPIRKYHQCNTNTTSTTTGNQFKNINQRLPTSVRQISIVVVVVAVHVYFTLFTMNIRTVNAFTTTRTSHIKLYEIRTTTVPVVAQTSMSSYGDHNTTEQPPPKLTTGTITMMPTTPASTTATPPKIPKQRRRRILFKFIRRIYNNCLSVTTYPFLLLRQQRLLLVTEDERTINETAVSSDETFQKNTLDIEIVDNDQEGIVINDGHDDVRTTSCSTGISSTSSRHHRNEQEEEIIQEQWNGKKWDIVISNDFIIEYDTYLQQLQQPYIVRSIAKQIIGQTTEETNIVRQQQHENNDNSAQSFSLLIRSINARGIWERTLATSGVVEILNTTTTSNSGCTSIPDIVSNFSKKNSFRPMSTSTVVTADNERVTAEAWWIRIINDNSTNKSDINCLVSSTLVHYSWLRGITKYGGGDFESIRYIVQSNNYDDDNDDDATSNSILMCHSIFHPSQQQRKPAYVTWRFRRSA